MKEKLTSKQKKFALEFLISGNITDAAKKAGYSERSARQIGSLNLTKPNVVEYMNEILEKTKSEEVATTEEVLEFLTSVMRGDIAEQFGLDPAITDRTKAAQLLMKRFNDNQRMDLELTKLEIDSFVKLNDEYSTQEQKVESLRQKVAAYANQRIPTTEYKEITAQIEQAQEKLNRLNDAKERFGATGGKVNSTSYKKMQYDIDELAKAIRYSLE